MKKYVFEVGKKYRASFPHNIYTVLRRTPKQITIIKEGDSKPIIRRIKVMAVIYQGEFVQLEKTNHSLILKAVSIYTGKDK